MPQWTLTTTEILEFLHHEKITPRPGSPWFDLKPDSSLPAAPPGPSDKRELRDAMLKIARPEVIQGILHCPPDPPTVRWFYGVYGDELMAGHHRDTQHNHTILWPLSAQDLTSLLELPLSIHQPEVIDGFALTLSREGFAAFTAIVDLCQEEALISALKRQYPGNVKFSSDDLIKVDQRHQQGLDLRWLGQLAKFISPAPFYVNVASLPVGLQELLTQQMLAEKDNYYQPALRFYEACSLLNACTGFSALTTRLLNGTKEAVAATWEHQHVAALRGLGSFWLLEFSPIGADDFRVNMGDVSADLLHKRLQAGISVHKAKSKPVLSSAPGPEDEITCPTCGAKLTGGTKFCNQCGATIPIPKSAGKSPESISMPVCSHCQAVVAANMKFCTQCGKPLKK
jgi:hypothetical protein